MSRWANKYVIGLTGNIAVGKSVVRQMLQHLGAYTIDADALSHQAMQPGAPAYKPIVDTFGQFILDSENRINRGLLGNIVFSNAVALGKLEAITHPIINAGINTLITRASQQVIVVEAIKLLEGDLANAVDSVWVVDAKPEMQYARLVQKRGMTESDAKQRIIAQNAQASKVLKANVVINNDGNVDETWKQVQTGWAGVQKAIAAGAISAPAAPPVTAAPAAAAPAVPPRPAPVQQTAPPAAPPPAPAAPRPPAVTAALPPLPQVTVKRGMPNNAEGIASFISKVANKSVNRMDIMMAFGQKSYLLAETPDGRIVALMGWQVENLITRVDEIYINPEVPLKPVLQALITSVEEASKELQSEVGLFFIPQNASQEMTQVFLNNEYQLSPIESIKIPAWREAARESMPPNTQIFARKLGERVLKPM